MRIRVLSLLALLVALVFDAGQMRLPRAQAEGAASTGLTLRCNPGQADIFVDGEKVGQTPLSGPLALSAGEHTIRVSRPGYTPFIDVFRVKPGSLTPLEVELIPISGVLRLTVENKAAHVYVDDKYIGDSPVESELTTGAHQIRIELAGHTPESFSVNAVAGQVIERTVSLQELPADQNPYARKPAPPVKWYQKWWVWTAAAAGVAVVATAIIVPVVLSNRDLCDGKLDVCRDVRTTTGALQLQLRF